MSKESYEKKKQEREARKQEQKKQAKKEQLSKRLGVFIMIGGSLAVVAVLIFFASKSRAPENLSGEFHPSQGDEHVAAPYSEPPYEWSTNPPTSGWHAPSPYPAGFYEDEIPMPRIIHSMEHGAVIVHYRPDISEEEKAKLKEFFDDNDNKKLLVVPYSDMETKYALTSWQFIDKFDQYDQERIKTFLNDHHGNGPENAPLGSH